MPRGAWGADHRVTYYWTLDNYNWPAINCDGTPTSGCPGTYIEQNDLRHVSNDPNNNLVDPEHEAVQGPGVRRGHGPRAEPPDVGRRPLRAQVGQQRDRGHRRAGRRHRRGLLHRQSGLRPRRLSARRPRSRGRRSRCATTTRSSSRSRRRLANNWSLNANITFSRLYGNYSGLSNSHVGVEPQQPERHAALGRAVHELHREGLPGPRELRRWRGQRPHQHGPADPVQGAGHVHAAVGHVGRRRLPGLQRQPADIVR